MAKLFLKKEGDASKPHPHRRQPGGQKLGYPWGIVMLRGHAAEMQLSTAVSQRSLTLAR